MRGWVLLGGLLAAVGVARADQCAWLTRAQGDKALLLLRPGNRVIRWCELCGEPKPPPQNAFPVTRAALMPAADGASVELTVNGEDQDLAYLFVESAEGSFANVANLLGCRTKGVSLTLGWKPASPSAPPALDASQVRDFARRLDELIRHMDTPGILALWAEDGTDILPNQPALHGKPQIALFMSQVTAKLAGYAVASQETRIDDIAVSGDLAVLTGTTDQTAVKPNGSNVEAHGNILLVLRRQADGQLRIVKEMWSAR